MEIKVVGDKTLFGELALEVQEETRETPLQVKLGKLAKQISTFGYIGAIAIVLGVMAKTLITGALPQGVYEWIRLVMDAITVAVTIIVCAVPEGLPMLTSILLSLTMLEKRLFSLTSRKSSPLKQRWLSAKYTVKMVNGNLMLLLLDTKADLKRSAVTMA